MTDVVLTHIGGPTMLIERRGAVLSVGIGRIRSVPTDRTGTPAR